MRIGVLGVLENTVSFANWSFGETPAPKDTLPMISCFGNTVVLSMHCKWDVWRCDWFVDGAHSHGVQVGCSCSRFACETQLGLCSTQLGRWCSLFAQWVHVVCSSLACVMHCVCVYAALPYTKCYAGVRHKQFAYIEHAGWLPQPASMFHASRIRGNLFSCWWFHYKCVHTCIAAHMQ